MILVRNCFVAKPGHASKLAAQLKEAAAAAAIPRYRVLTDLTADFSRATLISFATLSGFPLRKSRKRSVTSPDTAKQRVTHHRCPQDQVVTIVLELTLGQHACRAFLS